MTAKQNTTTVDLKSHFAELEDPRNGPALLHPLWSIIMIAVCAVICGADNWVEVETYGNAQAEWLGGFLELPNGIPSHDTFGRVFRRLDAEAFERCFTNWMQAVHEHTGGQVIAVDGKCLRHSYDTALDKAAIYMVSAWANANQMVLGQRKVAEKSNEITAIPELLAILDICGCIVSIDAIGTQKNIARQIVQQEGDYLLAVKDNQLHLREDIQALFAWAENLGFADIPSAYWKTTCQDHGRSEIRECWTISDPACIRMIADWQDWEELRTVVRVRAQRSLDGKTSCEDRYYISSCDNQGETMARQTLRNVRHHWGIENQLHWVLDIAFREDDCRIRKGHGDENFAVLRHIALNLLRRDNTRLGVHAKRLKAAWDTRYLSQLLTF